MNPLLAALLALCAAGALWLVVLFARGLYDMARRKQLAAAARPLRLVVRQRQDASASLFIVTLARPNGRRLPAFRPGQHLLLLTPAGRRAYSLAAWQARPRHYELGIKREDLGAVSGWLWEHLQPGRLVELWPPRGDFTLQHGVSDLVLIAGGIGITPLRAMLHAARAHDARRPVCLIHAARHRDELLWHEEFTTLAARHAEFRYLPVLSRPAPGWTGETGRLDAGRILSWLTAPQDADFYLCASAALMQALRDGLHAAGVDASRLHWEAFGAAAGSGGYGQRIALPDGRAWLTAGEPTLLASLEAHGCAPPSECRAGTCGQCRMRLLQGEVRWLLAPEIALAEGEILPCCCVAESDCRLELVGV